MGKRKEWKGKAYYTSFTGKGKKRKEGKGKCCVCWWSGRGEAGVEGRQERRGGGSGWALRHESEGGKDGRGDVRRLVLREGREEEKPGGGMTLYS